MRIAIITLGLAGLLLYACSNFDTAPCDAGADQSAAVSPDMAQPPAPKQDMSQPKAPCPDLATPPPADMAKPPCPDMTAPPPDMAKPPCPDMSVPCELCDESECNSDRQSCGSDTQKLEKIKKCHTVDQDDNNFFHRSCHKTKTTCHC